MSHEAKKRTEIDITPSPAYYRMMKENFQQSIKRYDTNISHHEKLRSLVLAEDFGTDTSEIHDLIDGVVNTEIATFQSSQKELQEGIAELERCGY